MIEALESVREFSVNDAKAMKDRGVEVAHVYRILYNVVAVLISFPIGDPGPYTCTGHPGREAAGMMVTAIIVLTQPALAVYRAPELARPSRARRFGPTRNGLHARSIRKGYALSRR